MCCLPSSSSCVVYARRHRPTRGLGRSSPERHPLLHFTFNSRPFSSVVIPRLIHLAVVSQRPDQSIDRQIEINLRRIGPPPPPPPLLPLLLPRHHNLYHHLIIIIIIIIIVSSSFHHLFLSLCLPPFISSITIYRIIYRIIYMSVPHLRQPAGGSGPSLIDRALGRCLRRWRRPACRCRWRRRM